MPTTWVITIAAEQADLAMGLILVEAVQGHRCHRAFVLFMRAVDVEVTQADDLATRNGQLPAHTLVEEELGVAVNVQWPLTFALFAKVPPGAIHRRRRGIQQRHLQPLGSFEQVAAEAVVVVHHEAPVAFDGAGAGTLVQHSADLAELAAGKALKEVVLVEVVSNFAVGQVAKLVAIGQIVNSDDLGFAALVEGLYQIATDKPGGAGHDNRHAISPSRVESRQSRQGLCTKINQDQ
ncbi:hypothetical protein D3C72_1222370 [compost metagenome]